MHCFFIRKLIIISL